MGTSATTEKKRIICLSSWRNCSEAQKHPEMREYFFGAHDENRVTFSTGRDLRLNPAQQGERLNFFIYPYAEVDGRPHDKIDRKVQYENLSAEP